MQRRRRPEAASEGESSRVGRAGAKREAGSRTEGGAGPESGVDPDSSWLPRRSEQLKAAWFESGKAWLRETEFESELRWSWRESQ